ncbi:hypothetical protein NDU88_008296, partial [Pleurodeles waltl]
TGRTIYLPSTSSFLLPWVEPHNPEQSSDASHAEADHANNRLTLPTHCQVPTATGSQGD